jgi:hypothetical protein
MAHAPSEMRDNETASFVGDNVSLVLIEGGGGGQPREGRWSWHHTLPASLL